MKKPLILMELIFSRKSDSYGHEYVMSYFYKVMAFSCCYL